MLAGALGNNEDELDDSLCPRLQELHISFDTDYSQVVSPGSLRALYKSKALRRDREVIGGKVFISEGMLGIQEDDPDEEDMCWVDDAQQSGLLEYPASESSWVDIF